MSNIFDSRSYGPVVNVKICPVTEVACNRLCGAIGGGHDYCALQMLPAKPEATSVRADATQVGGDHYKTLAIQPSEYIYKNKLGWHEGNAVKYITRHRIKGGKQDLLKARHYIDLLLEAEYPETTGEKS